MVQNNLILDKSFVFALNIIKYCELLQQQRKFVIANQLVRSGTSIGALVREAQNAASIADFCHKMKIAGKEAEETEYWFLLCKSSANHPPPGCLLTEIVSLKKILGKILSTVKKRNPK